jgi:AcrR family transcriptional regulator
MAGNPSAASRRRGAELERAILDAAWAELRQGGYASLTMGKVAARAKTSKAVLYRRWSNRAELVVAVIDRLVPELAPAVPSTGTLRGDMVAALRRTLRRWRGLELLGELGPDLIAHLRTRVFADAGEQIGAIVRGAQDRGDIGPQPLAGSIVRLPIDLLEHRVLLAKAPMSSQAVDEIVDGIILPLLKHHAPPRGA